MANHQGAPGGGQGGNLRAFFLGRQPLLRQFKRWRDALSFAQSSPTAWIRRDLKDEAIHPWGPIYVSEIHRPRPQRVLRLERKTDPDAIHGKPCTRLRP